ncbi:MAG: cytochrome c oxidase accessory protein FixG [Bacteroidia bacterium]|jgi:cytochrome c oxidase accessory protein FixG
MYQQKNTENFREHLANVTDKGSRIWLYPKIIKGKLYRYRSYLSYLYLAFFFAAPFIKIGGYPLLMLNVLERKFVILGQPFWPQDFHFLVLLLITLVVFIVLFTVIFGRVFCGWVCPQTIFMEMVFRKIEVAIEGSPSKQKKLAEMPWNAHKIYKRGLKFFVFFGVSFLIANTFFAYIIGWESLWAQITGPIQENYLTLISLLIFTTVFYVVFARLREIVCIIICPYGRLQGVMLDPNSMVVTYDEVRGEPRGRLRKSEVQTEKGDCVDCNLCVDVCPTGIDIRNGTQLECVNCTACIDACDGVMEKIDKPLGLIRIDSRNNVMNKVGFRWSARIIAYSVVMCLLIGVFVGLLITRTDVEANVLRVQGKTYTIDNEGNVINMYQLEMTNKTFEDKMVKMKLRNNKAQLIQMDKDSILSANEGEQKVFLIKMKSTDFRGGHLPMRMDLYIDNEKLKTFKTNFIGPLNGQILTDSTQTTKP